MGDHAGKHAAWWARNAVTLKLIADHERNPARAEAARADAVTAQRLAEGMATAHVAQADQPMPVPPSVGSYETELPDESALEDLEAGL